MKKIIIFLILIMVLFYSHNYKNDFTLTDYFSGDYSYYSNTKNEDSLNLGFCYLSKTKLKNSSTMGESITCKNLEVANAIKVLNAKVVYTEYFENGTTVIYAYSPLINKTVKVKNKNINLQFAITNNSTTIGWPLILGSF